MHNIEFTAIEKSANQVDFVRKFGNQVYYGNPKIQKFCERAGLKTPKFYHRDWRYWTIWRRSPLMPYAIIRIWPSWHVPKTVSRYRLRDVGVKYIWRGIYLTSLDMSRETLEYWAWIQKATKTVQKCSVTMMTHWLNASAPSIKMKQRWLPPAQSAIQELESLFDSDMTTAKHELHKEKSD